MSDIPEFISETNEYKWIQCTWEINELTKKIYKLLLENARETTKGNYYENIITKY